LKFVLNIFFGLTILSVANGEVVDRVLAIVNSKIVTKSDLEGFQKRFKSKGLLDEALLGFYDSKKVSTDDATALAYLIDERLIDGEVERQGIATPIERIEGEIRNTLARSGTSRETLKTMLKSRGLTYAQYQDHIRTSLQRQSLLQKEISSKIKISEEDIAAAYVQATKDTKALVFEYELAHILFSPNNGGLSGAKDRADLVVRKLESGNSFESLAAQYSEDPDFSQGGVFGTVRVGEIVPSLEKALVGLAPGATTGVVQMADGFHVFKILKRTLVPSPDFERNRGRIADKLFSEAFQRQYFVWIEVLRLSSYVKLNK